jgi:release factor glutamine methyltransferase
VATEIQALIEEGAARLARTADDPRREAQLLLAAALGRSRASLLANPDERILDCDATDRYESHLTRRAIGEPVAYILGEKEFWSLKLAITRDVLVPRAETELLVERALAHLPPGTRGRVLDLGTGSGAVALAVAHERPACRVLGTDASPPAVALAASNARRLELANAYFATGDWYEPAGDGRFHLITCNPPYVADDDPELAWQVRRHEPPRALFAGPTGLEALRTVVSGAASRLVGGGWLVLEHGAAQGEAVRALLGAVGFTAVATFHDLAGHERCTEGRWGHSPFRRVGSGSP